MQQKVGKPPGRMVRKQFLITADQNRQLKQRASELGVTEAEIVRDGIDKALQEGSGNDQGWRERLLKLLDEQPLGEDFAERVRENKKVQAELWRRRLERTRKLMAGK